MDLNVFFNSKTNSSMLVSPPAINQEYTNTSESNAESKVLPENDVARWLLAHCSVIVFLAGIILARFGLWIVDLTVNTSSVYTISDYGRSSTSPLTASGTTLLNLSVGDGVGFQMTRAGGNAGNATSTGQVCVQLVD